METSAHWNACVHVLFCRPRFCQKYPMVLCIVYCRSYQIGQVRISVLFSVSQKYVFKNLCIGLFCSCIRNQKLYNIGKMMQLLQSIVDVCRCTTSSIVQIVCSSGVVLAEVFSHLQWTFVFYWMLAKQMFQCGNMFWFTAICDCYHLLS